MSRRQWRQSLRILCGGWVIIYSLSCDSGPFAARLAFSPALWRDEGVIVSRPWEALAASEDIDTSAGHPSGSGRSTSTGNRPR